MTGKQISFICLILIMVKQTSKRHQYHMHSYEFGGTSQTIETAALNFGCVDMCGTDKSEIGDSQTIFFFTFSIIYIFSYSLHGLHFFSCRFSLWSNKKEKNIDKLCDLNEQRTFNKQQRTFI